MKKLFPLLAILLLTLACDNDLDITAEYKDLTVMYGILDPNQDTNYIRIQRGYLSADPASLSFDRPDSLYYDTADIEVVIREYEENGSEILNEATLIYDDSKNLEEGVFTTEGFYLYRLPADFVLNDEREYEVVVFRADGTQASARTGLVGRIDIDRPVAPISSRFFDGSIWFDTRGGSEQMVAFQTVIYFNYREVNLRTGEELFKTERIELPQVENRFGDIRLLYESSDLNNALASRIEPNPEIIRFFVDMEIEVFGASEELMTFIELSRPVSGVNQNRPDYQQVINGAGILTSRTSQSRDEIRLERSRFFPNLIAGRASCGLNFAEVQNVANNRDTCVCNNNERECPPNTKDFLLNVKNYND
jgi:hypothetical protein